MWLLLRLPPPWHHLALNVVALLAIDYTPASYEMGEKPGEKVYNCPKKNFKNPQVNDTK